MSQLADIVDRSRSIVFFGGAGVSTESGIPDFRSADGLYSQATGLSYAPEEILSHSFFMSYPQEFFQFYQTKILHPEARPNSAHLALAELERCGKVSAVITQNIDGLHQLAGSHEVMELHGSVHRNYCCECGRRYGLTAVLDAPSVPRCACGGIIRPDVVLYEEPLDDTVMAKAVRALERADTLIVGGTSLAVYPAAGLITVFRGDNLVLINKEPTPADRNATLVIHDAIGATLKEFLPQS